MQIVQSPSIIYSNIKLNNQNISLGGNIKASFSAPYNRIDITFKSTNVSLNKFKVAVTSAADTNYGVDIGQQIILATNIAYNTNTTVQLPINSTLFNKGNIQYRILLCAQSAVDDSWDLTEMFMCLGGSTFATADDPSAALQVQVVTHD